MTDLQIKNLYLFYFLYNGADRDCDILKQSPDYLLEKWNKLIGINGNEIKYPELLESQLFQEWRKIWLRGRTNPISDNIMMFLIKTHKREREGKYCHFLTLYNLFQKYIGRTYEITQEEYKHLHPHLVKAVQNEIERKVKDEDVREVLLNNMLS